MRDGGNAGLVISGSVGSAPDQVFALATELDAAADALHDAQRRLTRIDGYVTSAGIVAAGMSWSAIRAEQTIDGAALRLAGTADECRDLAEALRRAAQQYERTERTVVSAMETTVGATAWLLGRAVQWIGAGMLASPQALAVLPVLLGGGAAIVRVLRARAHRSADREPGPAGDAEPDGGGGAVEQLWQTLAGPEGPLSTPAGVTAVQLVFGSVDEFLAGTHGDSWHEAELSSERGFGISGADTSAGAVVAAGAALGLFPRMQTVVHEVARTTAPPPQGVAARLAAVPQGDPAITITRAARPDGTVRAEVSIGGTQDWSPIGGPEPFDMSSNVRSMAGEWSASTDAVLRAMDDAGLRDRDEVVFVGYSQGGLIAAQLGASGLYDTAGVLAIGAPIDQMPHGAYPVLSLEHTDDVVVALDGLDHTPAFGGFTPGEGFARPTEPLRVEREAYPDGTTAPDVTFPAHRREAYAETAAFVDASRSAEVRSAVAAFDGGFAGVDEVTVTRYSAESTDVEVPRRGPEVRLGTVAPLPVDVWRDAPVVLPEIPGMPTLESPFGGQSGEKVSGSASRGGAR